MTLTKCNVCGYVIQKDDLEEVCPACGAKKRVFEPYSSKLSEKRRKFLSYHLHPIMTHFSVGSAILFLFIVFIIVFFPDKASLALMGSAYVFSIIMPIAGFLTMVTGLIDGKIRFKRLNPPHLKSKIYVGSAFLILSIINASIVAGDLIAANEYRASLLLAIALVGCAGYLGKLGGTLICAQTSGK